MRSRSRDDELPSAELLDFLGEPGDDPIDPLSFDEDVPEDSDETEPLPGLEGDPR